MYGVEKRFKMQLFLGLKGSPLVGGTILNFVTPDSILAQDFMGQINSRIEVVLGCWNLTAQ